MHHNGYQVFQFFTGLINERSNSAFYNCPLNQATINTYDLGAWWSLQTDVNELHYNMNWSGRINRLQGLLADLNGKILKSWQFWKTLYGYQKLQNTLYQNYQPALATQRRNHYDRRSAPPNPIYSQLQEQVLQARIGPPCLEATELRKI